MGWIVFFIIFSKADDLRDLGGCRIAAVGPANLAKLKGLHLKIDLMPDCYTAEGVAAAFRDSEEYSIENENVALPRAWRTRNCHANWNPLGQSWMTFPFTKPQETEDRNGAVARLQEEEPIGLLLPAVPQWIILTRGLVWWRVGKARASLALARKQPSH